MRFFTPLARITVALMLMSMTATVQAQTVEFNTDRMGGDFDRVTLALSNHKICQKICSDTDQCVAWTYTPPGYNDYETPQCWLKDRAPRAFERKQSVSGTFPAKIAALSADVESQPPSDAAAIALKECKDSWIPLSMCMGMKAGDELDVSLCDIMEGLDRENCHSSTGFHVMKQCVALEDETDSALCQRTAAVEFASGKACYLVDPDYAIECYMTVALESGDPRYLLTELAFLPSRERDIEIAAYAGMAHDFDMLELIEDNRIYDLALITISAWRIGAGKYVGPGICSKLVGGYSDQGGDLSAAGQREMCHGAIAMARVISEYGETHTIEELMELQDSMQEFFVFGDDEDISMFPPELREEMEQALAQSKSEFAAATPTQSGYTQTPSSTVTPAVPPQQSVDETLPVVNENCVFGLCDE